MSAVAGRTVGITSDQIAEVNYLIGAMVTEAASLERELSMAIIDLTDAPPHDTFTKICGKTGGVLKDRLTTRAEERGLADNAFSELMGRVKSAIENRNHVVHGARILSPQDGTISASNWSHKAEVELVELRPVYLRELTQELRDLWVTVSRWATMQWIILNKGQNATRQIAPDPDYSKPDDAGQLGDDA